MDVKKLFIVLSFPALVGIGIVVYQNPAYWHIASVVIGTIFWRLFRYLQNDSIRPSDFAIHKSSIEDSVLTSSSSQSDQQTPTHNK